nr:cellulose-binding family protein [uncultured bacterium]
MFTITRNGLLAGVLAAAALLVAPPAATGDVAVQADPVRVMPLGDSITDGFNVPGGYRIDLWQKIVAGGRSADFVGSQTNGPGNLGDRNHEGHSGWTIAQIDANIVNWLRTFTPRTVLLHIGTNDMYGSDPAGAPARLSTLIDRITTTAPNADVFVATIVPISFADQTVRTFNATIPGIVQSKVNAGKRVHLVDMYRALTTADLADGVHPNAGGYSKMATTWYNALLSVPGSIGDPTQEPPPTGTCAATASVVNTWNGGYQADVSVRNNTSTHLTGWTVSLTLANGQTITNLWGAVPASTGTVKNAAYNGTVTGGGTTTFGFVASGPGTPSVTTTSCTSP